jgi:hypothetical protein
MNVARSAAKKPVLTVTLALDIVCTGVALAMGIYLLISLPSPFPTTYVKIAKERVEGVWWAFFIGGVLLLLYG